MEGFFFYDVVLYLGEDLKRFRLTHAGSHNSRNSITRQATQSSGICSLASARKSNPTFAGERLPQQHTKNLPRASLSIQTPT